MLNNTQRRLAIIAFFIGLNLVLGTYFMGIVRLGVPKPMAEILYRMGVMPNAATTVNEITSPIVEEPDLSAQGLLESINEFREGAGHEPLARNSLLAKAAVELLDLAAKNNYDTDSNFESGALESALKDSGYIYERVSHNALVGPLTIDGVMTAWFSDKNESEALLNSEFSDAGIATEIIDHPENGRMGIIIQLLGKQRPAARSEAPTDESSPPPPRNIPDSEVIEALNNYRAAHKLPALKTNDNLCTYAQKRAADLAENGGLDGHAGFKEDFADPENPPPGIAEYKRGSKIGENLAHQFCKNMTTGESFIAETGTALIEWCFDSSTKGHREAQLSTEFKNVCVRHADNMYVVIFGS